MFILLDLEKTLNLPEAISRVIIKHMKILQSALLLVAIVFMSAILAGAMMALGENITLAGMQVVFDPALTIAYLLLYQLLANIYFMDKRANYKFLLFALLLSFTTNLVQGVFMMVLVPPLFKRFHLIS